MNTNWLKIPKEERIEILNQSSNITGLPPIAIEKDWWVTLTLKASFELPYSKHIVFKGGTSLSKAWNLIERFSEDIDLAIDRGFFGFEGDINKRQIKNLRRKSCEFISTSLLQDLKNKFIECNAITECKFNIQPFKDSDKDPQVIEIHYDSVFDKSDYLQQRVLIEIGSRSLIEPSESREINAILNESFPDKSYADSPFKISTVLVQRTFLEKIFLLHEEFSKNTANIRIEKLSRHLYDIEKLMDTDHATEALKNTDLYNNIVSHREKFNTITGLDYANHVSGKIKIIPPDEVIKEWEKDYQTMTEYMIYGKFLNFEELINRIKKLQKRINEINQR